MLDPTLFCDMTIKTVEKVKEKLSSSDDLKSAAGAVAVVTAAENMETGLVIPVNCFPLEYILGQNGLPLNRTITIQGPTASSKSSMYWFWVRLVLGHGGFAGYFDLENKHDPNLAGSYIGNPIAGSAIPPKGRLAVIRSGGPEGFAQIFQKWTEELRKAYLDEKLTKPLIIGVDTLGSNIMSKFSTSQRAGKTEPNFLFAQTVAHIQGTLASWVQQYLSQLPVILVLLQQERVQMETQRIYATGGRFVGFSKSVGLRMCRHDYWASLDEDFPVVRIEQEKNSTNTKRNVDVILPTKCHRNEAGFREFSFDWAYAMLRLLSDLPSSILEGLFTVKRDTEKTFTITVPAAKNRTTSIGEKYRCSKTHYADIGWQMVNDRELLKELRARLHIIEHPCVECPYEVPNLLDGRFWLSPDELDPGEDFNSLTQEQILTRHIEFMRSIRKGPASEIKQQEESQAPVPQEQEAQKLQKQANAQDIKSDNKPQISKGSVEEWFKV